MGHTLPNSGVCISMNNTATPDTTTNLVACTPVKDKCTYNTGYAAQPTITKECTCGFNPNGNAYCEKGQQIDADKWTSLYKSKADQYDNNCHVISRTNCYLTSQKLLTNTNTYQWATEENHLYYGADDCAYKVLSSAYINLSVLSILGILLMIFI